MMVRSEIGALIIFGMVVLIAGVVSFVFLLANPKTQPGATTVLKSMTSLAWIIIPVTALMIPLSVVVLIFSEPTRTAAKRPMVQHIGSAPMPAPPPAPPATVLGHENSREAVNAYKEALETYTSTMIKSRVDTARKSTKKADDARKTAPAKDADKDGKETVKAVAKKEQMQAEKEKEDIKGEKAKPDWVDAAPKTVKNVYAATVVVGPYTTREECDAKLAEEIQKAVDRYVEAALGLSAVGVVRLPNDYIVRNLVKDRWEEVRQYSVGPMTRLHVLVEFDRKAKDRIAEEYRRAMVAERLQTAALWSGLGLSLMAMVFGYLKITGIRGRRG